MTRELLPDESGIGELIAQWNDPLPLRTPLGEDGPGGRVNIVSQWRDRTRLESETTHSDPGPDYAVVCYAAGHPGCPAARLDALWRPDSLLTLPGELCQRTREPDIEYRVVVNPKEAHHGTT